MHKLSERELLTRDATRDLEAEMQASIAELKAGDIGRVSVVSDDGIVTVSLVAKARVSSRLSQSQFANLLGVSVRTLQEWEQGRRTPSGAAKTLLKIATHNPDALRAVV